MVFQIRWLNIFLNYKKLKIQNPKFDVNIPKVIVNDDTITDDDMVKKRKYFFRPNLKNFLQQKNIKKL